MNIGIYIYENAEVLDFSGPFEVLSTAKRLSDQSWSISLVSEHHAPVLARGGFQILPHQSIAADTQFDVLIVVGGIHDAEVKKSAVINWIQHQASQAQYVVSVCTGAFLLAEAGLLDGLSVTTHRQDIADLKAQYPALNVVTNQRWVEQGRILTSAGISAGIDMTLCLVAKLVSPELAKKTALQMEYDWRDSNVNS